MTLRRSARVDSPKGGRMDKVPEGVTRFEFRRAKNGLIMSVQHSDPEYNNEYTYQESDGEDDIERFADFLRYVDDDFGPSTSRYSKKRIYISIGPGDKHEDYDPDGEF